MLDFAAGKDKCLLLGKPGSGKSMAAITLALETLAQWGGKALVVAPTIPARDGWAAELLRWHQTADLTVRHISAADLGYKRSTDVSTKGRLQVADPKAVKAHILSLPERVHTVAWNNLFHLTLTLQGSDFPYVVVVADEIEYSQSHGSKIFQAMKHIAWEQHVALLLMLSGTLASNSPEQLWAPAYLCDKGARFGKNITQFRTQFLLPDKVDKRVGRVFSYKVDPAMADTLAERMGQIAISVPTPLDCEIVENREYIGLPASVLVTYRELKRQLMAVLQNGTPIDAPNAAALTGKLRQIASGACYDADRVVHVLHTEKLNRLEEMMPALGPTIVLYQFQHEKAALVKRFPQARDVRNPGMVVEFSRGSVPLLLCQFQAASHGIDGLQHGGHDVVVYTPPYERGRYDQAIARIARPGQKNPVVTVHQLCALRTIDEVLYDDVLPGKLSLQEALLSRTWM